jgi:hypothetical protein
MTEGVQERGKGGKREGRKKQKNKYGKKQRAKHFKRVVQLNKPIKSQPYCMQRVQLFSIIE